MFYFNFKLSYYVPNVVSLIFDQVHAHNKIIIHTLFCNFDKSVTNVGFKLGQLNLKVTIWIQSPMGKPQSLIKLTQSNGDFVCTYILFKITFRLQLSYNKRKCFNICCCRYLIYIDIWCIIWSTILFDLNNNLSKYSFSIFYKIIYYRTYNYS